MSLCILASGDRRVVASAFQQMAQAVTGEEYPIRGDREDDGVSDLVLIGSDAVNYHVHELVMAGLFDPAPVRMGGDDYRMFSLEENGRRILVLAGGRRRADFYAVYDYFERYCGCRYFWDGDRVPKSESLVLREVDFAKRFRFRYRGLRYFAHRSLHRFQAEHWELDEWRAELDWLLKKRFNLFMLRMGQDDLFQRAFPEDVPYPPADGRAPEALARSYNDRTSLYSLRERGELQKSILAMARERDLIQPEDMGAMTHWYTPTPKAFLDKFKPEYLLQSRGCYQGHAPLAIWDFSDDRMLDAYWKLTEKHIEQYGGRPEMFHIIGLAERAFGGREENFKWKRYTFRRFIERLREKYPMAPLLIASWDFLSKWSPDEVRELLRELDPANTIIFDYTTDCRFRDNNFRTWGLPYQFPWVHGIFQALEPDSDLTYDFARPEASLELVAEDPYCQGMVLWSENSHANAMLLEYLARKSSSETFSQETFARDRYGEKFAAPMLELWRFTREAFAENAYIHDPAQPCSGLFKTHFNLLLWFQKLLSFQNDFGEKAVLEGRRKVDHLAIPKAFWPLAARLLREASDPQTRRDLFDLARTAMLAEIGIEQNRLFQAFASFRRGGSGDGVTPERLVRAIALMGEFLRHHEDFSMTATLRRTQAHHRLNFVAEEVLKGNGENAYCRSYIAEFYPAIYIPEAEALAAWMRDAVARGKRDEEPDFTAESSRIRDAFYAAPLAKFAPDAADFTDAAAADAADRFADFIAAR